MFPTVPLFLFLLWLSLSRGFEVKPKLTLSSNVTSLKAGQSAKLTCHVASFTPGTKHYTVAFYRDVHSVFCSYHISDTNSTGHRSITFNNNTRAEPSLARQPVSSTFPAYEITVTPTVVGTKKYWCTLRRDTPSIDVHSRHLPLTLTPPPSALLSSDVISPLPRQPFTLSCTFEHITGHWGNYSVQFSSSRDGPLAVYDVHSGKSLLVDEINEKVDVSHGHRSTYPNFDLLITEKVNISSEYWCALVGISKAPVRSNTWPIKVQFTGSKPAENQRAAICSVVGATSLHLNNKPYTVQFVSDLGPKSVNLLAEYTFNPAFGEEFKSANVTSWGAIHYGASTSWPNFSILANGTGSLHGTWWCVLAIGAQGTPESREFTSDKATL